MSGDLLPFLPRAERQPPSQGPGGTLRALQQVVKKTFSLGSRNPTAEKDCFIRADLGLLAHIFHFQPAQVTRRMLWLSCQKMGLGHTKAKVFLWASALFIFTLNKTSDLRSPDAQGQWQGFLSGDRTYLLERTPCPSTWCLQHPCKCLISEPHSLPPSLGTSLCLIFYYFCPFLSLFHSSSQFPPVHVTESMSWFWLG